MKLVQTIICTVFLVCMWSLLAGQDKIYLADGNTIEGRIVEIGWEVVKFRPQDNPDGPIFSQPKSAIKKIAFENGYEESFGPRITDVITLRDGKEMRVDIVEISQKEVIYKEDFQLHKIPLTQVAYITLKNGKVEKIAGLEPKKKKRERKKKKEN